MAFLIQRVPRGLQNLLSLQSGDGPQVLNDTVVGILDLLQLYGLTQLQSGNASGNPAEAAFVTLTLPSSWCVLFGAHCNFTKTATMTALRAEIYYRRSFAAFSQLIFSEELGPFAATETGNAAVGGVLPYPVILPPSSVVQATPSILGTDATVGVNLFAEFGVLG